MTTRLSHIQRTATQPRYQYAYNATITKLNMVTPTVKHVQLTINDIATDDIDNIAYSKILQSQQHTTSQNTQLKFDAGQWVDVFIPTVDIIGGYTITSTPQHYMDTNTIDLHIKYSKHKPAHWLHTQAKINDTVKIRVGGTFIYSSAMNDSVHKQNVIFIAGGVGVNTVYNMLCVRMYVLSQLYSNNSSNMPQTTFLYTAKTMNELLFHNEISALAQQFGTQLHYHYSVTGSQGKRISGDQIQPHLTEPIDSNIVYMCGPPNMVDSLNEQLSTVMRTEQVLYEKWW